MRVQATVHVPVGTVAEVAIVAVAVVVVVLVVDVAVAVVVVIVLAATAQPNAGPSLENPIPLIKEYTLNHTIKAPTI